MHSKSALKTVLAPRLPKSLVAAIALAVCAPAGALELNGSTTLTARHSDNTFRTEDDEKNNFSLEPGLLLDGFHNGPNLQAALDYQFERRFHTEDGNSDRNFLSGGANINWMVLPERLELNLEQSSTESTRAAGQVGAPNEKEVTDNLSVGPTLFFRLRDTDRLSFTYLYEDSNAIIDESDSTSDVLTASYELGLSEYSTLTAQHREEDIEFSSDLVADLDVTRQTLSYNYRNDSVSLTITGGYSEYERDGADTVKGNVGEFNWRRDSGFTAFSLFARREITNQSSRLFRNLDDIDLDDFTLFIDANIAEVFIETGYGFSLTQQVGATSVRFEAEAYRYDYEELVADREEYIITIGAERRIRRNITLDVAARYRDSEDDDQPATPIVPAIPGQEGELFVLKASLDWNLASNLHIGAGVEYRNDADSYDETLSFVTATYELFKRR